MKRPILGAAIGAIVFLVGALFDAHGSPVASAKTRDGAVLARAKNCSTCHSGDGAGSAPSFHAIAAKYRNDPTAAAKLEDKVKNGGSGAWGSKAMPPQNVSSSESAVLTKWVLGQQ